MKEGNIQSAFQHLPYCLKGTYNVSRENFGIIVVWGEGDQNICRQEEMVVLLFNEENLKPL